MSVAIPFDVLTVFGSGILAFLATYTTVIWRVSSAKNSIEDKIVTAEHQAEIERAKLREELLNSKLDALDRFINKGSFEAFIKGLEARLLRLETKLDKVLDKNA